MLGLVPHVPFGMTAVLATHLHAILILTKASTDRGEAGRRTFDETQVYTFVLWYLERFGAHSRL